MAETVTSVFGGHISGTRPSPSAYGVRQCNVNAADRLGVISTANEIVG
jgi:hypothetical protein